MPSAMRSRRMKPFLTLLVLIVLTILYLSSSARSTRDSEFYRNTVAALQKQHQQQTQEVDNTRSDTSDAKLKQDLQDAGTRAKEVANRKGDEMRKKLGMEELEQSGQVPLKDTAKDKEQVQAVSVEPSDDEKSAAGRKSMKDEATNVAAEKSMDAKSSASKETTNAKAEEEDDEAEEAAKVDAELNSILKRSPIILFSKTYCPYSKKAKRILLESYKITPAPYVVELDVHELGPQLQAALAKSTGRRTVPNVMINGKSIGGGDDIQDLHESGKLIDTVKTMGGKRIMEASLVKDSPVGEDGLRRRRTRR